MVLEYYWRILIIRWYSQSTENESMPHSQNHTKQLRLSLIVSVCGKPKPAVGITKFKYLFQMTHSNVFMPMGKSKLQLKDWVPKLKDKLYIGHKTS